jgi:hypothetical protein
MPLNYPRDDCHKQAVIHIRESRQFEFAEGGSGHGALNGLRWSEGGGESSWAHRSGAREGRCGDGRKTGGDSGGTLLKGAAGRQQPGGGGLVARMPCEAWGLAPTGGGLLGRHSNGWQREGMGERDAGVRGPARKEKWSGPSPNEQ